jgi:hypothetical protein
MEMTKEPFTANQSCYLIISARREKFMHFHISSLLLLPVALHVIYAEMANEA